MKKLPELERLEKLIPQLNEFGEVRRLAVVNAKGVDLPIYGIILGTKNKEVPTLGLFGGVHGLERVGTHAVLAYLESLLAQLAWDKQLRELLMQSRLVSIPIVNPGGMLLGKRSNPQGVDLMRNAPVESREKVMFLLGGHRISPKLPWYRGEEKQEMQLEAKVLIDFIREEMFPSRMATALDIHSGFGARDRLWFPYAKTTEPFPHIKEVMMFKDLLDRSYPNHIYLVEPQSLNYTTHGDLWDYIYDLHRAEKKKEMLIPWTLEMGSWIWVRKNPPQLLSVLGVFNPLKPHRLKRAMRRHLPLIDFFFRATRNFEVWTKI